MKKQVTFIISAALNQTANGRVVIEGYYLMQVSKTWYGREKYKVLGKFDKDTDAIATLNKLLGNK